MTNRHRAVDAGPERRERLSRARLQVLIGPSDGDVVSLATASVRGGADVVQLRWKGGGTAEVAALAAELVRAVGERALVLVNDDVEAARIAGADGVHVGEDDLPPEEARRRLGAGLLVCLSTHDATAAAAAQARGADAIGFGAMYRTATKEQPRIIGPGALATLEGLRIPCFAIGGIDLTNVADVVAAGARRIAVSRAVVGADDPEDAARRLRAALDR